LPVDNIFFVYILGTRTLNLKREVAMINNIQKREEIFTASKISAVVVVTSTTALAYPGNLTGTLAINC
jgi:hypothetical protein